MLTVLSPVTACLQLACLLEWGQTFVFHVVCREYELERPKSVMICQHGIDRRFCESKVRKETCQRLINIYGFLKWKVEMSAVNQLYVVTK